jgi:hypothetical protein
MVPVVFSHSVFGTKAAVNADCGWTHNLVHHRCSGCEMPHKWFLLTGQRPCFCRLDLPVRSSAGRRLVGKKGFQINRLFRQPALQLMYLKHKNQWWFTIFYANSRHIIFDSCHDSIYVNKKIVIRLFITLTHRRLWRPFVNVMLTCLFMEEVLGTSNGFLLPDF